MKAADIYFFNEDSGYVLKDKTLVRKWLNSCAGTEGLRIGNLNYIFCSDIFLKKMNKKYLNHDYFTDIITFDTGSNKHEISGDIFISVDRVRENARNYDTRITGELHRVMVHGLLHLCGYGDKTEKESKKMRMLEEACLKKRGAKLK